MQAGLASVVRNLQQLGRAGQEEANNANMAWIREGTLKVNHRYKERLGTCYLSDRQGAVECNHLGHWLHQPGENKQFTFSHIQ